MADALMGAGAAANVVGGLMQSVAAGMAKRAMEQEFAREMQRQQGYRNQAYGILQTGLPQEGVEQARTDIAAGSEKRQQSYADVGQTQLGFGAQPTSMDQALYTMLGKGRANLGGYSDWQLGRAISKIRQQDEINKISNFAGGTAGIFPLRMDEASKEGDELAFWGSLISSLGGGAGAFAGSGASAPRYGSGGGQMNPADMNNMFAAFGAI